MPLPPRVYDVSTVAMLRALRVLFYGGHFDLDSRLGPEAMDLTILLSGSL